MNNDTGQIHEINEATMKDFIKGMSMADRPKFGFTELGNMPVEGCEKCKGTGVARIMPNGRRIPCACTNPKK